MGDIPIRQESQRPTPNEPAQINSVKVQRPDNSIEAAERVGQGVNKAVENTMNFTNMFHALAMKKQQRQYDILKSLRIRAAAETINESEHRRGFDTPEQAQQFSNDLFHQYAKQYDYAPEFVEKWLNSDEGIETNNVVEVKIDASQLKAMKDAELIELDEKGTYLANAGYLAGLSEDEIEANIREYAFKNTTANKAETEQAVRKHMVELEMRKIKEMYNANPRKLISWLKGKDNAKYISTDDKAYFIKEAEKKLDARQTREKEMTNTEILTQFFVEQETNANKGAAGLQGKLYADQIRKAAAENPDQFLREGVVIGGHRIKATADEAATAWANSQRILKQGNSNAAMAAQQGFNDWTENTIILEKSGFKALGLWETLDHIGTIEAMRTHNIFAENANMSPHEDKALIALGQKADKRYAQLDGNSNPTVEAVVIKTAQRLRQKFNMDEVQYGKTLENLMNFTRKKEMGKNSTDPTDTSRIIKYAANDFIALEVDNLYGIEAANTDAVAIGSGDLVTKHNKRNSATPILPTNVSTPKATIGNTNVPTSRD